MKIGEPYLDKLSSSSCRSAEATNICGGSILQQGRVTILFLGLAHALDHSFLSALPPILLLIVNDLGLSLGEVSLAATFGYLLFGAGALVGGPLSDRIGEGRVVFISLALSGVSTLILLIDRRFAGLFAAFILMSGWSSFYHPTANSLISKAYHGEVGRVMGVHGVGGSIGQIFVPSVAVFLALAVGWRFSFVFFGVLSIVTSVYFIRLRLTGKRETETKHKGSPILRDSRFWALFVYNIMMGLYYRGTELFLPAYLTMVRGLSIETSGMAVSLLMAFGVLGQFLGGTGTDRMGGANALFIESALVAVGFACLQLQNPVAAVVFLFLFGVAFYATQPTTNALTAEIASPDQRGLVYGIMFFLVFGLGSVSSAMAGHVAEIFGLQSTFSAMFLLSLFALASSIVLRRRWSPKGRS